MRPAILLATVDPGGQACSLGAVLAAAHSPRTSREPSSRYRWLSRGSVGGQMSA